MAPFGGIKDSGYGKEAGIESIKEYKIIKTKRISWVLIICNAFILY
jgi:acyl-CoA reductase-like NAD-dependent aldehyde dehydrogenase